MTSETSMPAHGPQHRDQELDRRYGAIGISAVAAAIRYQGMARNPKSFERHAVPADASLDERFERAA